MHHFLERFCKNFMGKHQLVIQVFQRVLYSLHLFSQNLESVVIFSGHLNDPNHFLMLEFLSLNVMKIKLGYMNIKIIMIT